MKKISVQEILHAVQGKLICGSEDVLIDTISTDSRKIVQGCLFIPIKGEKFDGHDFLVSSLKNGALAALTQIEVPQMDEKVIIRVEDTLVALKMLAKWYREQFDIKVVGITGSVGKTSTKDMIAKVLEQKYKVLKTEGNFNNEIGLPLTVFNLNDSHEVAILEMGMSNSGEIGRLTRIAQPDVAVITNVGVSHIENLGSRENILKAKIEIVEGLKSNGLLIVNNDNDLLKTVEGKIPARSATFGIDFAADYRAIDLYNKGEKGVSFSFIEEGESHRVNIPVPGLHNVYNALCAIAVGKELGLTIHQIIEGIAQYLPSKMRMDIYSIKEVKVINDAYNASPQSMEAAIRVLKDIADAGRSIAILGDMLELGGYSEEAHRNVGTFVAEAGVDMLFACGPLASYIAKEAINKGMQGDQVFHFEKNDLAISTLRRTLKKGDTILLKGSRGMKMEEIIELLGLSSMEHSQR